MMSPSSMQRMKRKRTDMFKTKCYSSPGKRGCDTDQDGGERMVQNTAVGQIQQCP